MTGWPELVVHIGPGKTGSTAIQRTLGEHRETLLAHGIAYLGMALEHAQGAPPRDWQAPARVHQLFHGMETAEAARELRAVLGAELDRLGAMGIRQAVWSNEAIFARREGVAEALLRMRDEGLPLRLIAYLRRHDDWARSAYAQWGIRHKSYEGPVMPFADWIAARPPRFAEPLAFWQDRFGKALHLRNYDEIPDVAADLLAFLGAPALPTGRSYETPGAALLVAWAVHNSRERPERLPESFRQLLGPSKVLDGGLPALPPPETLFPTAEDLARVMADSADDIAAVNAILAEKGIAPLPLDPAPDGPGAAPPSTWELLQLTMTMVFSLQEQVNRLKQRLGLPDGR